MLQKRQKQVICSAFIFLATALAALLFLHFSVLFPRGSRAENEAKWARVTSVAELQTDDKLLIVSEADGAYHVLSTPKADKPQFEAVGATYSADKGLCPASGAAEIHLTKTADGNFTLRVASGYLRAAGEDEDTEKKLYTENTVTTASTWIITVTETQTTVAACNGVKFNKIKYNKSADVFCCYGNGQCDITLYRLVKTSSTDGGNSSGNGGNSSVDSSMGGSSEAFPSVCGHKNTTTEHTEPTCQKEGQDKVICVDCGDVVSVTILNKTRHAYVDGVCKDCNVPLDTTKDFSGVYNLAFLQGERYLYTDGTAWIYQHYTARAETELGRENERYLFQLAKQSDGTYRICDFQHGQPIFEENTFYIEETEGGFYIFTGKCFYLSLDVGEGENHVKLAKLISGYPHLVTLFKFDCEAQISDVSVAFMQSISVKYTVRMDAKLQGAELFYRVGAETVEHVSTNVPQTDGTVVYYVPLAPHLMTEHVEVRLLKNGLTYLTDSAFMMREYLQGKLNNPQSEEQKNLIGATLRYGAEAQKYQGYRTDDLATDGVENLPAESEALPTAMDDAVLRVDPIQNNLPAYFSGATVLFSSTLKIRLRITFTDKVTDLTKLQVFVEGNKAALKLNEDGYCYVTTEGLAAHRCGSAISFRLYYDGVELQDLAYGVNTYAYRMQGDEAMGTLALATYRYALAAQVYFGVQK